jgi:hypothetical protein
MSLTVNNDLIFCEIKKSSDFYNWLDKVNEHYGIDNVHVVGKKAYIKTNSYPLKTEVLYRFYEELKAS